MALTLFPQTSKSVKLQDGTTYAYVHIPASDPASPTFLLLHGFPSSSFDWRHVITLLQQNGYGVIAPDLLGYGDTDKPEQFTAYSMKRMADHLKELVQSERLEKVIAVGHDFGSVLLSWAVLVHPSSFVGAVFTSVGYHPPGTFDVDQVIAISEQVLGFPTFGYWKFFNEDGAASVLDANPDSVTSLLYPHDPEDSKTMLNPIDAAKSFITDGKTGSLPAWLKEEDAQKRTDIFRKGGYTGPLNWYKAAMRNVDAAYASTLKTDEDKMVSLPTMVVVCEHDCICVADFQKPAATTYLRNLRLESLACGHWIQLEKPAELVKMLEDFGQSLGTV